MFVIIMFGIDDIWVVEMCICGIVDNILLILLFFISKVVGCEFLMKMELM